MPNKPYRMYKTYKAYTLLVATATAVAFAAFAPPALAAPSTPSNFRKSSIGETSVTWAWNNGVSGAAYYQVGDSGGSVKGTTDVDTTFTETGFGVNTQQTRKVRACDSGGGCSGWSNTASAYTANSAPSPSVSPSSGTSYSYTVSPSPAPAAPSPSSPTFNFYYSLNSSWYSDTNARSFSTINCEANFNFCTKARNGDGIETGQVCVSRQAPPCQNNVTNPSPSSGTTGVSLTPTLRWTAPAAPSNPITGRYRVNLGSFSTCSVSGTSAACWTLSPNTSYSWAVSYEYNAPGGGTGWYQSSPGYSFTTGAAPAPSSAPTGFRGTAGSPTSISWDWNPGSGGSGVTYYRFNTTNVGDTDGYAQTGLNCGTSYSATLAACNGSGCGPTASASASPGACPLPDLIPNGVTVPPVNICTNMSLTLTGSVRTQGSGNVSGSYSNRLAVGSQSCTASASNAPNAGSNTNVSCTLTTPGSAGTYPVSLQVDTNNNISESNESNNGATTYSNLGVSAPVCTSASSCGSTTYGAWSACTRSSSTSCSGTRTRTMLSWTCNNAGTCNSSCTQTVSTTPPETCSIDGLSCSGPANYCYSPSSCDTRSREQQCVSGTCSTTTFMNYQDTNGTSCSGQSCGSYSDSCLANPGKLRDYASSSGSCSSSSEACNAPSYTDRCVSGQCGASCSDGNTCSSEQCIGANSAYYQTRSSACQSHCSCSSSWASGTCQQSWNECGERVQCYTGSNCNTSAGSCSCNTGYTSDGSGGCYSYSWYQSGFSSCGGAVRSITRI